MYDHNSTAAVTCNEKLQIFRIESALRANAKREPSLDLAIYFGQSSLLVQKQRHLHEEACPVCLAAERTVN